MAEQKKSNKIGRSERRGKRSPSITAANKKRRAEARVERFAAIAVKRAERVFAGGLKGAKAKKQIASIEKKRETRRRLSGYSKSMRHEATLSGERQFGSKAPRYHQLRMTPDAFVAMLKRNKGIEPQVPETAAGQ